MTERDGLAGSLSAATHTHDQTAKINNRAKRTNRKSTIFPAGLAIVGALCSFQVMAQGYALSDGAPTPNTLDRITVQGFTIVPNPLGPTAMYGLDRLRQDSTIGGFTPAFRPNVGDGGKDNASGGTGCGGENPAVGEPIVVGTGTLIEPELDFAATGEMGLFLSRTYNSKITLPGIFGRGWLSNFDKRLRFQYDTNVVCEAVQGNAPCALSKYSINIWAVRPDGRAILFLTFSGGFKEAKPGAIAHLIHTSTGTDTLYTEDNTVEVYQDGLIQTETDAHGVGWTYTYGGVSGTQLQKVVHTNGRQVSFTWSGQQLVSVTDPAGNIYRYAYDNSTGSARRLSSVVLPGNPVTTNTYSYQAATGNYQLKDKIVNGATQFSFTFDAAGRANQSQRPDGVERTSLVYTADAQGNITQAVVTNALNKSAVYAYAQNKLTSITGAASANCPATYKERQYDANGYTSVVSDFEGGLTKTTYNSKGQLLQQIEAFGTPVARTTDIVWDPSVNRRSSVTTAGYVRNSYTYNPDNRVASIAVTNLSSNGALNQTRTTTYAYTKFANGMMQTMTIDGSLQGVSDYKKVSYNSMGDLISIENSLGQLRTFSGHNGLGQPGRIVDFSGAVTEYEYDARGRLVAERLFPNGSPVETRFVYGASGLLDAKTHSNGSSVYYHYDAAQRLVQEDLTEPGGGFAVKRYTYNAMSNPIKIEIGRDN